MGQVVADDDDTHDHDHDHDHDDHHDDSCFGQCGFWKEGEKIKLEQVWALGGLQVRKSVCNKISTKKKNNEWYGSCIFCFGKSDQPLKKNNNHSNTFLLDKICSKTLVLKFFNSNLLQAVSS
jgi:hypothetical protein